MKRGKWRAQFVHASLSDLTQGYKWEDHCPFNAPEGDSEGQTLQIIPSLLIFSRCSSPSPWLRKEGDTNRNVGAAAWLGKTFHRCVANGEELSLSRCHSHPSSCPDPGSSFTGNNWNVRDLIQTSLNSTSHIFNCTLRMGKNKKRHYQRNLSAKDVANAEEHLTVI